MYFPNYQENNSLCFTMNFYDLETFNVKTWDVEIPFSQNDTLDELEIDEKTGKVVLTFNGNLVVVLFAQEVQFTYIDPQDGSFHPFPR